MLDRTKAPPIQTIDQLVLPSPEIIQLDNGIPVYVTDMGTQDVIRMEMVFLSGRPFEKKRLASRATVAMLKEGTLHCDSATIAETLDYYGASLSQVFNLDTGNLVLYCLSKHFQPLASLCKEMLDVPTFPERELQTFIKRNQKALKSDLAKIDVVAYRTITEKVFGAHHPYGYNSTADTYGALKREDLIAHFQSSYGTNNCKIFLSGRVTPSIIKTLNEQIGQINRTSNLFKQPMLVDTPESGKCKVDHQDSVQTAIRIGRRLFNRHHPDYAGFYMLNTILGGYFGSRLMNNIREDKGYTYNIYSSVDVMRHEGAFYISTEVNNEFTDNTLTEIRQELNDLIEKPVEEEEMTMVRNYLMGNFLSMLDGPFNVSELVRTLASDELPFSFFSDLVRKVHEVEADELQALAKKYLQPDDMWEVIVG